MYYLRAWLIVGAFVLATGAVGCECAETTTTMTGDGGNQNDLTGVIEDGFWLGGDGPIQIVDGGIVIRDDGGTFTCYQTTCQGKLLQCGDCLDNDGDGLIDFRDPECLGPCDNTETPALLAGIGGETGGPCKADCYFDFGNGPGNDDCHWDHRCDPLEVGPNFPPEGSGCGFSQNMVGGKDCPNTQSTQCLNYCRPLTPNGCDCFGCCTFPQLAGGGDGGGDKYVWLGSVIEGTNTGTCTFADINDPTKCKPCTPVQGCFNACARCEICLGKPTVPADCTPPDGGYTLPDGFVIPPDFGGIPYCDVGEQPCGVGLPDCPVDFYCITGCCKPTVIIM